jgi:hypothetical protein
MQGVKQTMAHNASFVDKPEDVTVFTTFLSNFFFSVRHKNLV